MHCSSNFCRQRAVLSPHGGGIMQPLFRLEQRVMGTNKAEFCQLEVLPSGGYQGCFQVDAVGSKKSESAPSTQPMEWRGRVGAALFLVLALWGEIGTLFLPSRFPTAEMRLPWAMEPKYDSTDSGPVAHHLVEPAVKAEAPTFRGCLNLGVRNLPILALQTAVMLRTYFSRLSSLTLYTSSALLAYSK